MARLKPSRPDWKYWLNKLGPVIGLVLIFLFFAVIGPPGFSTTRNVEMIARQTTVVGIAALGMTLIIISGGIDLSVGSMVAFSTVTIALALKLGISPILAAVSGVLSGIVWGIVNGSLVTRLKVVPFIVTLGTLLLVRGAAKGLASEQKVNAPITWLNELLAALGPGQKWMVLPPGVWLLIVLAIVVAVVLWFTRFGRYIFALGSNENASRLCGVPVDRVKVMVYAIGGGFAGLAGLMQFARLSVGDPTVSVGLELQVIAAVVIGGGSLSGGEGSILGTLVGALIMTVIRAGCQQTGYSNWVQEIVTGAIIVFAVALDQWRNRSAA